MEKGIHPPESAPPYPGPPMNYTGMGPQPEMCAPPSYATQPGIPTQSGYATQPGFPTQSGYATQPGFPTQSGYATQPGNYAAPAGYGGGPAFAPVPTQPPVSHVIVSTPLSDVPGHTFCVHCQQSVITRTEHTTGLLTWAICAGMCLFGLWLCCCIPCCIDSCQDVEHHCPRCQHVLHIYKRM